MNKFTTFIFFEASSLPYLFGVEARFSFVNSLMSLIKKTA